MAEELSAELSLSEVLALVEEKSGKPLARSTWRSYVARGQAPAPVRYIGREPLYSTEAIAQWIEQRPGRGARTDLRP